MSHKTPDGLDCSDPDCVFNKLIKGSDLADEGRGVSEDLANPPTQALINKAVIKELEQLDPYERCDTFCDIQCDHAGKVIQERLKELRGAA